MVINNVSVQYNGGFLPDIILYFSVGPYETKIGEQYHEELLSLQPMFPPKFFDVPPEGECSRGLDACRFFVNIFLTKA